MRALIAAMLLLPASAMAQVDVPRVLGYQGRLIRGAEAETGQISVIFRIYDKDVGGALKWEEKQTVLLSNGFYAVFLGSQKPFPPDLFDGNSRWLELEIEGDSMPLTPRQQVGSVAYSMTAGTALNVSGGGTVTATGGTFTGPVTVPTPTKPEHAATMQYVDRLPTRSSTWSARQTFNGGVAVPPSVPGSADAVQRSEMDAGDAATRAYVDSRFVVAGRVRGSDGSVVSQVGTTTVSCVRDRTGYYTVTVRDLSSNAIVVASTANPQHPVPITTVIVRSGSFSVMTTSLAGSYQNSVDEDFSFIVVKL